MSAPRRRAPHPLTVAFPARAPTPALVQQLASLGIAIVPATASALAVVVTERSDRPPPRPPGPGWIWMAPALPAVAAIQAAVGAGALDVVDGRASPGELAARIAARAEEQAVEPELPPEAPELVAEGPAARRLIAELHHAARTSMPVLLTGETGTGKEVAARLLHAWSSRRQRRFVPVNCAAIPNEMLEAELFGYEKGAFSGSVRRYEGQLAAAEAGTVFLDEVDDTPLSFQVKILRVVEDRVVSRLGENVWHKVDFRIVAATNRDLRELIARGQFMPDLYQRLAIVAIRLPPLRERPEDVPALCRLLVARFYRDEPAARARHQVVEVTPAAMAVLAAHAWPGNIRELRNVLYGALVRKRSGRELLVSDLPPRLLRPLKPGETGPALLPAEAIARALDRGAFNLRATIEAIERTALAEALARSRGNAAAAAGLLGEVGRGSARDPGATVRAMMRRLGLAPGGRP
jgi:DNA-binding NtrC family response regulator